MVSRPEGALYVRGIPIVSLADMQTLAWEVPEELHPPGLVTWWVAGDDVEPAALFEALDGETRRVLEDQPAGLEVLERILDALRDAFPESVPAGR